MVNKNHFPLFIIIFLLVGCSKVQHLDELLTLKRISDEQAAMAKEVEVVDKKFEALMAEVDSGHIAAYKNQEKIVRKFGPPIIFDEREKDGVLYDVWLYRYATQFFGSDKVYLYFDKTGALQDWQLMKAEASIQ